MKCEACQKKGVELITRFLDGNQMNFEPDNLLDLCERCNVRIQALNPPATSRESAIRRLRARAMMDGFLPTFWE